MSKEKIHKRNKRLFWLLEYVTLLLPYVVWFIAKREVYFTSVEQTISVSIGGAACIVVFVLAVNNKIGFLKGLGGFIALGLITWLLAPVMNDLTWISIIGGSGFLVSCIFKKLKLHEQKYCDAYITKEVNNE